MQTTIIVIMCLALVVVLIGFGLMIKGGALNRRYSNKLMTLRVALQALVVAMIFMIAYVAKH
jgi:hypothetical protein